MQLVHESVRAAVYCSQDLNPRIQVHSSQTTNPSSLGGFGRCLMEGLRPFHDHHVNIIVIFEDKHRCSLTGGVCRWKNTIKIVCVSLLSTMRVVVFWAWCCAWDKSSTESHKSSARLPSNPRPTFHEIISVLVLLCETSV